MRLLTIFALRARFGLAFATWEPGRQLEFGERIWWRRCGHLPRSAALLMGEEQQAWLYDIINMKAYCGHKCHCHRWTIVIAHDHHSFIAGMEQPPLSSGSGARPVWSA